jgi:hypothetical protein
MTVAELALQQEYIGHFEVTDTEINWFPEQSWSWYRDFGDMVYFMFVGNKLMKIGKACGWTSRVGMYKNGASPRGDQTNKRIIRTMSELETNEVHIYAVRSPRLKVSLTNPLDGSTIETELETAHRLEKYLTSQYLSESTNNTLPFSKQLK